MTSCDASLRVGWEDDADEYTCDGKCDGYRHVHTLPGFGTVMWTDAHPLAVRR